MTDSRRGREHGYVEFDPKVGFTLDDARALTNGTQRRESDALALHHNLQATGDLQRHTLIEYRCSTDRHCLLLRVFRTPYGRPAFYKPPFRLSPKRNASTSPAARARRTSDGDRRWIESADLVDLGAPDGLGLELWLNCDHVSDYPLPAVALERDLATRRKKITLPR